MTKGSNAWNRMVRGFEGAPNLEPLSEEQADIEIFGADVEARVPVRAAVGAEEFASRDRLNEGLDEEDHKGQEFGGQARRAENSAGEAASHSIPTSASASPSPLITLGWVFVTSFTLVGVWGDLSGSTSVPAEFFAAAAHVAFIFMAVCLTISDRRRAAPVAANCDIVPEVFRQFLNGWTLLWTSWLSLYTFVAARVWFTEGTAIDGLAQTTTNLIHILSSYAFLYLFLVLDRPSVPIKAHPDRAHDFRVSLAAIQVVCSVTGVLSVVAYFELVPGIGPVAVWAASLLAAISMMYFFMGLGYRELRIQRLKLAPLFLYVALQMLYPVIAGLGAIESTQFALPTSQVILWAALALKVHLFLLVRRWILNGRLIEYLEEVKYPRSTRDLQ